MRLAFQNFSFPFYIEYKDIPVTWMIIVLWLYLCKNHSAYQTVIDMQKSMQN